MVYLQSPSWGSGWEVELGFQCEVARLNDATRQNMMPWKYLSSQSKIKRSPSLIMSDGNRIRDLVTFIQGMRRQAPNFVDSSATRFNWASRSLAKFPILPTLMPWKGLFVVSMTVPLSHSSTILCTEVCNYDLDSEVSVISNSWGPLHKDFPRVALSEHLLRF